MTAAAGLLAVRNHGRSLTAVRSQWVAALQNSRDQALAQELLFGSLRWLQRLDGLLQAVMRRPLRVRDADIYAILIIGAYQLLYTAVPAYAAIAIASAIAANSRKPWACGLVNGVLRRISRESQPLLTTVDHRSECRLSHPRWLLRRFRDDWPQDWEQIAIANNTRAPMTLRVHRGHGSTDAYRQRLRASGMIATAPAYAPDALVLSNPVAVSKLPGFDCGQVSVQDAGAQLACDLLAPKPRDRILDACAAPGTKAAHLLEREPEIAELVTVESAADRVVLLQQTLQRLNLTATVVHGDATCPATWWHGKPMQRILIDAPCSATGVIRRWPDIKLHRRPEDLIAMPRFQRRLLEALWPLLSPGGTLLYVTCSILDCENAGLVAAFVHDHSDAIVMPIAVDWGRAMRIGRQIMTGDDGMDGFYYALLQKRV